MTFGGGMAAGMGAGIGAGIAIGVSGGRKRAASELREHIEKNGITILDRQGKPIKIEQLVDDALGQRCCGTAAVGASKIWAFLLGSLVVGLLAAVAIYFLSAV